MGPPFNGKYGCEQSCHADAPDFCEMFFETHPQSEAACLPANSTFGLREEVEGMLFSLEVPECYSDSTNQPADEESRRL